MNAQVRKIMDECPSYMVAEWALPALINGDYTGMTGSGPQLSLYKQ